MYHSYYAVGRLHRTFFTGGRALGGRLPLFNEVPRAMILGTSEGKKESELLDPGLETV